MVIRRFHISNYFHNNIQYTDRRSDIVYSVAFFQGRDLTFWPPKIGEKPDKMLREISNNVKALVKDTSHSSSHFRYVRHRDGFNKIGIEILNGGASCDTVYTILRTGTFIRDFADAIANFRAHSGTRLVVIVPDSDTFLSNFGGALQTWITDLYENPDCAGVRGLLLEPGKAKPNEARMRGYFFVSDGHVHEDDDGFYTNTAYSARFLFGYFQSLIRAGKHMELSDRKLSASE